MKIRNLIFSIAIGTVLFISCGKSPEVTPVNHYTLNQPVNKPSSSTSSNYIQNPNGTNLPRPLIPGSLEVVIGVDTFSSNALPEDGYGYTYTTTEPGRFICKLYLNSTVNTTVSSYINTTIEISTLLSPMIGIHTLGWNYDVPWTHNTYVNDVILTYYTLSSSSGSTYSLCTETHLPVAPTTYKVSILSSSITNNITVISGTFTADVCLNSRNHSAGSLSLKGTFTNLPLYPN